MLPLVGAALNVTTPSPIKRAGREVAAFLRGPVAGITHAFGNRDELRFHRWHSAALKVLPEPQDNSGNDFGFQEGGGFTADIAISKNWLVNGDFEAGMPAFFDFPDGGGLTRTISTDTPQDGGKSLHITTMVGGHNVLWPDGFLAPSGKAEIHLWARNNGYDNDWVGDPGNGLNAPVFVTLYDTVTLAYVAIPAAFFTAGALPVVGQWRLSTYSFNNLVPGRLYKVGMQIDGNNGTYAVDVDSVGVYFFDDDGLPIPAPGLSQVADQWRNQVCDLELVTRLRREDDTVVEFTNERRAVLKSARRKKDVLSLTFADIDRAALDKVFPFETFTTADFPELFVDHVNRRIPQGVGTVPKVPLTWIVKTGGLWKYAGPKVIGTAGTPLTVYRDGRIIAPAEYTVGTAVGASTGVTVVTVNFAKEQIDERGKPYEITADYSLPGSRLPADEIKRVLLLYGRTIDASSFDAAALYDQVQGFAVDPGYVEGRTGNAIIEDLLFPARSDLKQQPDGSYALVQDRPRDVTRTFDEGADVMDFEEYGDAEIPKAITMEYRPKTASKEEFTAKLERTTTGAAGAKVWRCPYVRDHVVADRLMSYWQKRYNSLRTGTAIFHAVQLTQGEVLAVHGRLTWAGYKRFIAAAISRPVDRNAVTLREYDPAIYPYTAGTLPADATNLYTPDYSQTPPTAPGNPSVVSQGTSINEDGTETAFALLRVAGGSVPTVNVAKVFIVVVNTTNNTQRIAELLLTAGNYELRVDGLMPNRTHQMFAYCENAFGLKGLVSGTVGFTSAEFTTAPAAPTGVGIGQDSATSLRVVWNAPTFSNFKEHIVFRQVDGGSFVEYRRTDATYLQDNAVLIGHTYGYIIRAVDRGGNESSNSGTASLGVVRWIDDTTVIAQGIGTPSLTNSSVSRGKTYTTTGSANFAMATGLSGNVALELFSFFPSIAWLYGGPGKLTAGAVTGDDTGRFAILNDSGLLAEYSIIWRNFQP